VRRGVWIPLEDRFWPKIEIRGEDECWPWTAGTFQGREYGQFQVHAGEADREKDGPVRAHRLAFRLIHGRWPASEALHGCDNPSCCNAVSRLHIHEGDNLMNVREREERGRTACGFSAGNPQILAAEGVALIRSLHTPGIVTYDDLAAQFGVSRPTIWRVLQGVQPYGAADHD